MGLSVLYIIKKEIFFSSQKFEYGNLWAAYTFAKVFFVLMNVLNESVSLQRIHQYLTQVVTLFFPSIYSVSTMFLSRSVGLRIKISTMFLSRSVDLRMLTPTEFPSRSLDLQILTSTGRVETSEWWHRLSFFLGVQNSAWYSTSTSYILQSRPQNAGIYFVYCISRRADCRKLTEASESPGVILYFWQCTSQNNVDIDNDYFWQCGICNPTRPRQGVTEH